MKTVILRRAVPGALAALMLLAPGRAPAGQTQVSNSSTETIQIGAAGYQANFSVSWSCDDAPQSTTSAPGQVDLLNAAGAVVGSVSATLGSGSPVVHVTGPGSVGGAQGWEALAGAGGTPAEGSLSASWTLTGLAAGSYTLRFWTFQEAQAGRSASTIVTQTVDAGGGGPLSPSPTPTPTPTPSPSPSPTPTPSPTPSPSPVPTPTPTAYPTPTPTPTPSPTPTPTPSPSPFPTPTPSPTPTPTAAFFTLSLAATVGGSVSGGGSYAPGAVAAASAAAAPGYAFAGWSGDASGTTPVMSVAMDANKALLATFTALLAQTITLGAPTTVTTRSAPFSLQASASSGLPVTITVESGPASITGYTMSVNGTQGVVVIQATQAGNSQYLPAPPVTLSVTVGAPPPGVIVGIGSAATKRGDKDTRVTSYLSTQP